MSKLISPPPSSFRVMLMIINQAMIISQQLVNRSTATVKKEPLPDVVRWRVAGHGWGEKMVEQCSMNTSSNTWVFFELIAFSVSGQQRQRERKREREREREKMNFFVIDRKCWIEEREGDTHERQNVLR